MEKGIKINSKDLEGKTALNYAITAGDMETVTMLVQLGAELNTIDKYGMSPAA